MDDHIFRFNSSDSTKKLNLSRKFKINLLISVFIIASFSLFFIFNIVIHSKLESIELKIYKNRKNHFFSFIFFDDIELLKTFKSIIYVLLQLLSGLELLIVYINIIYLIIHPFIGLKLIFVVNISYYCLLILKIIIQGHRPFWDLKNLNLTRKIQCQTDYASPSRFLFFIFFFYLYSIISIQKMKKKKFKFIHRFLIFFIHFIISFVIIVLMTASFNDFFHQLIFTVILGYILICLLLAEDKNIHNFIFQTLKNIYNARKYKIKIFFYVLGLLIITLIASYFINEEDLNEIKQKLKDCSEDNLFGMKESLNDIGRIFNIVGAVWGASFTLEKNISKWWDKSPKLILFAKTIIIILFNGIFILIKYFLQQIKNIEFIFILKTFINFFQNFLSFGIIPLIFEKFGLIENKRKSKKINKLKNNNEDEQEVLFKTTIFKEEKESKDDGFVVLDKEVKKSEKKDEIKESEKKEINLNNESKEENEFIYDKNKEEKEEIYGHSNLVENVQNLEEEEGEEEFLYLEGIEGLNE